MSTENEQKESFDLVEMTGREMHLIKDALMKEITRLATRQTNASRKGGRDKFKKLKLELFAVYQKLN